MSAIQFLKNVLTFAGARRDRTVDPLLAKQVLSQLSYGPKNMGLDRLELSTPRLSSVCSNQLSYRPILNITRSVNTLICNFSPHN